MTFIILAFLYFSEKDSIALLYMVSEARFGDVSLAALRVWFLPVSFAGISLHSSERRPKNETHAYSLLSPLSHSVSFLLRESCLLYDSLYRW